MQPQISQEPFNWTDNDPRTPSQSEDAARDAAPTRQPQTGGGKLKKLSTSNKPSGSPVSFG